MRGKQLYPAKGSRNRSFCICPYSSEDEHTASTRWTGVRIPLGAQQLLAERIDMPDFSDEEAVMQYLEQEGAMIWSGMAEDGEPIYRFNLEKLKLVYPALYDSLLEELDGDLMLLYEEGLVDIEYDEQLVPRFKLSEKGIKFAKDHPFLE